MLRDIYTMFLTYHHILPDEVGRQNPWVLFKMLDGLNEDTEDYDNEHLRMFYGEEASGLINALATAQNALATLNSSAGKIMSEFDGKNAKINITAVDNTASGVSSARASINSLKDRTVNVTVKYNVQGMPKLADGTQYAKSGLAVVNDERGVSDPRELIEHNGRLMMFSGRDVVVPLSQGDKVYTADETKAIMNGMGIPHYASGKNNEMFEIKKADLNHYKKTNDVSPTEELRLWNELMEQFSYD